MRLKLILAGLLFLTAAPVFAQVVPQATDRNIPFYAGGGYSRYSPDWGPGRTLDGLDAYVGLTLPKIHFIPAGLGVEAEWRDHFFHPSVSQQILDEGFVISQMAMGGGVIYKYTRYPKFRPYAKYFIEQGKNTCCYSPTGSTSGAGSFYDMVTVMGGGVEYKVKTHYWIRGDYSYETWPNLFGNNKANNPQGVTLGLTYSFQR